MNLIPVVITYCGNASGEPSSEEPWQRIELRKALPFVPLPGMQLVAGEGPRSDIVLDRDAVERNDGLSCWFNPDGSHEIHLNAHLRNGNYVCPIDELIAHFQSCGWEVKRVEDMPDPE